MIDLDPKGMGETENERLCRERAMSQWEASTKRPDLDERARVLGAIQAYQRQAFVLSGHLSATVPAGDAIDRTIARLQALPDYAGRPAWDTVLREELAASRLSQGTGVTIERAFKDGVHYATIVDVPNTEEARDEAWRCSKVRALSGDTL